MGEKKTRREKRRENKFSLVWMKKEKWEEGKAGEKIRCGTHHIFSPHMKRF